MKDSQVKLRVDLETAVEVEATPKFAIQIKTASRNYILSFESELEQKRWLSTLKQVMEVAILRRTAIKTTQGLFWPSCAEICKLLHIYESDVLQTLEEKGTLHCQFKF